MNPITPAEMDLEQLRLDLDDAQRRLERVGKASHELEEQERAVADLAKQLRLARRQLRRMKDEHTLAVAEVRRGFKKHRKGADE